MPPRLTIDIAEKRYRRDGHPYPILRDLQFGVEHGEFICLLGPSGCGKTTLLNLISGLDGDFEGEVRLAPDTRLGYLFQSPRLMPWLTALDNVRLVMASSPTARERAAELLRRVELGDHLHAFPRQLSGGMQRRVALARAFAPDPTLLLMDEPFVSLDRPIADRLRELLISLWQHQARTVIFVSHDLNEAIALGDRILFLGGEPSQLVWQRSVELPRPRRVDDPGVATLRERWLREQPALLAGSVTASPPLPLNAAHRPG